MTKSDSVFSIWNLSACESCSYATCIEKTRSPGSRYDSWLMFSCHFRRLGAGGISKSRYFSNNLAIRWIRIAPGIPSVFLSSEHLIQIAVDAAHHERQKYKQWKWTSSAGLSFIIRNSYHNAQSNSITKIMAKFMEYKNHPKEVTPHQRPFTLYE